MRYSIFLILTVCSFAAKAQQSQLSYMFWNNYAHYNPATSGLLWGHELNVTYRDQWNKVNGAPVTFFANYNTIVAGKHGAGINYVYDQIGFSKAHIANVNYNYQFKLKNDDKIALGIAAGTHTYSMGPEWIPPTVEPDAALPSAFFQTSLNINTGIAYASRRILTGIGVTQLSPRKYDGFIDFSPHLHGHFNYRLPLTRKSGLFLGGITHTDFIKISYTISARYTYMQKLWLGINYRNHKSISANVTWDFKNKFRKFRVGYSYGITLSKLSSISRGTHEIVLGMRIL